MNRENRVSGDAVEKALQPPPPLLNDIRVLGILVRHGDHGNIELLRQRGEHTGGACPGQGVPQRLKIRIPPNDSMSLMNHHSSSSNSSHKKTIVGEKAVPEENVGGGGEAQVRQSPLGRQCERPFHPQSSWGLSRRSVIPFAASDRQRSSRRCCHRGTRRDKGN